MVPRLPVELLSRVQIAEELEQLVAHRAMLAAYEAELVLALADDSPESEDPPVKGRGGSSWSSARRLPGVSEYFSAELSMVLNCGRGTADHLAARAWTWREALPRTWAALAAGVLDEPRAKVLARVFEHADVDIARRVEAVLLPEATELSLNRLEKRAIALRLEFAEEAAAADAAAQEQAAAEAAESEGGEQPVDDSDTAGADTGFDEAEPVTEADRVHQEAQRAADVRLYPSPVDGMVTLSVDLPAAEGAACYDVVDQCAAMLKADGDVRPIGQLRTRVWADMVLRVWDDSRPPVTAQLTVTATLTALAGTSAEAGEVNGLAISASHVRRLLRELDALGVHAPKSGSVTVAMTDPDGALVATASIEELRRLARRGCPDHPAADDTTDTADGGGGGGGDEGGDEGGGGVEVARDCGCAVLGRPPAVDRYTPSAKQQTFVHTRDRTCRFPNCGQRVGWADADHVIPHDCDGPTDCTNLCCLCRSHHRLKTFARGWHFQMTPDGVLIVTTPSGITRTTRPPGMRPPAPPDPADPRTADAPDSDDDVEVVETPDDPPPF